MKRADTPNIPDVADFRAEIGRRNILRYRLAAIVGLSPSRLGQILNGRLPLTPDLAQRIAAALREDDARRGPVGAPQQARPAAPHTTRRLGARSG